MARNTNGLFSAVTRHPIISGVFALCGVTGIVLGFVYGPEDWPWIRQFFAGLFAGLVCALFITAQFMIEAAAEGSAASDDE